MVATIVSLLVLGALSYQALPKAYCPLEDKTVHYVHISDSKKTVTKVIPSSSEEGNWNVLGDRCQKGREIGQWIPINEESVKKPTLILAYTDEGKFICEGVGEGQRCTPHDEILSVLG